jgi:hypothetical protein
MLTSIIHYQLQNTIDLLLADAKTALFRQKSENNREDEAEKRQKHLV